MNYETIDTKAVAAYNARHALGRKLLAATKGTKLGAIIACALGVERDALPRFTSKAVVTSDGFVQANFVDRNGVTRHSAFVGSYDDLLDNLERLSNHLELSFEEHTQLSELLTSWIAVRY